MDTKLGNTDKIVSVVADGFSPILRSCDYLCMKYGCSCGNHECRYSGAKRDGPTLDLLGRL